MRTSTLAFVGFVLACVCWLAGLIVCLCAVQRRDRALVDDRGLSTTTGTLIIATLGIAGSRLITS